ncbi:hypothetical protein CRUP_016057, partial [Coryphaenoides rupestris]
MWPTPRNVQGGKTDQCYVLPGGGRVLVRHGDITKEQADALVNAANRYLSHNGGVAAALSRAGAVESFGRQSIHLKTITLIDTRAEVVRALLVACDRILPSDNAERGAAGDGEFPESTGASAPRPSPNYGASTVNPEDEEGATVSPMKVYDSRSTGWDHAIHSSTNQSNQPPPEHNLISTSRKAETQIGHLSDQPVTQYMDTLHFTRDHMWPTPRNVQGGKTDQCYVLPGGGRVLVRHGDITKEQADALVNAADGYLTHSGGVAAALSRAGGFSVQRESTALVSEHGPYATGESVMTTGGNMQCKKLIHIVGPVQGEANGQERQLLARSVLAEVVRALLVACDRVFPSANAELGAAGGGEFQESPGASAPRPLSNYGANPVNRGPDASDIQNVVGYIEEQIVDVIVSPMKESDPRSTEVGKTLSNIIGRKMLDAAFSNLKKDHRELVEVNVMDLKELSCNKVFFVNLIPWKENDEEAVQ